MKLDQILEGYGDFEGQHSSIDANDPLMLKLAGLASKIRNTQMPGTSWASAVTILTNPQYEDRIKRSVIDKFNPKLLDQFWKVLGDIESQYGDVLDSIDDETIQSVFNVVANVRQHLRLKLDQQISDLVSKH